ncbi:hypothetical protein Ciccas_009078 [Cichlidogyrus casuarinus]|uniref:HTH La-type RNA-binding domain-containing protein n=1 Tax=Cichlidogyrus casuarinus TaxID=1844966 RepID=A0ABD2PYB0_9PLAT
MEDQTPGPRISSAQADDKKKAKPQWVPTNIEMTYRPTNRPGPPQQTPRGSGFGTRPRRTQPAGRPALPRAPNGFVKSGGPRQGIPRSFSKEDTSSASVDAQKDAVHSEHASVKSNSPPIKNEIRRNGNPDTNPSDHSLSTRVNPQKERSYGPKTGRKNTDEGVKLGPFDPLMPFATPTASLGLLNDSQLLLSPIISDLPAGFPQQIIHSVPQTATASIPAQVMGEVVDLAQVISTIEKVGWDKAHLPESLRDDPEILKAQARAGYVRENDKRTIEAGSNQPKNDVVIVDFRIFFVSKSQFNTKFVKFTTKLDYIRHHLAYLQGALIDASFSYSLTGSLVHRGYYFSDSNLTRDVHLQKILEANNEACPVRDLLQFNRLRIVNTTETELLEAAANCSVVQVSSTDDKTCLIPLKRLAKVTDVPASDVIPIMQPLFLAPQPSLFDQTVATPNTAPDIVTSPMIDQNAVYPVYTSAPDTDATETPTTHTPSSSTTATSVAQPQVSSPAAAPALPQNGIPVSMPMLGLPSLSNILISHTSPALHPFG